MCIRDSFWIYGKILLPGVLTAVPSAMVLTCGSVVTFPAAKEACIQFAPAGSTPMTLIFGFRSFASVDTPVASPPPVSYTHLIGQTFGQCFKLDFSGVHVFDFIAVVCAFLFVDMFDTLGTLIGVANKADMLDKDGRLPRIKEALLADAVATTAGAVLGTSTTTTFVESSSGVAAGARTGLSSVVTGFLFLISVVLSPIFCSIPSFATAPALIFVGFLMVSTVTSIEFTDMTEAIPAYLCLLAMPLMYSISCLLYTSRCV